MSAPRVQKALTNVPVPPADVRSDPADPVSSSRLFQVAYRALRSIIIKTNGLLSLGTGVDRSWSGDINGQYLDVVFDPVAGTQTRIEHGLGRIPVFFFANGYSTTADVYAGTADRASWNSTEIFLKCNIAGATIKLLIV